MRIMPLEKRDVTTSRLVLGCMRLGGSWDNSPIAEEDVVKMEKAIDQALSLGITMFDHADVYALGKAEEVFGKVIKARPDLREQMVIQSKCGFRFADEIGPIRYDLSKEHIIGSVNGILKRLSVEYIDVLLLHQPDPLVEPEEVAEAFHILKTSGKVRNFGVSNMNKGQMELLQAYCEQPIIVNQLEMSLLKLDWLNQGVTVNQEAGKAVNFGEGLLEHCMLKNIQIQAWSPMAKGIYSGKDVKDLSDAQINTRELVTKMAEEKGTTREAIVLGWLMRHPAKIQPVLGITNLERIKNCYDAIRQSELMNREEWFSLYVTARGNRLT